MNGQDNKLNVLASYFESFVCPAEPHCLGTYCDNWLLSVSDTAWTFCSGNIARGCCNCCRRYPLEAFLTCRDLKAKIKETIASCYYFCSHVPGYKSCAPPFSFSAQRDLPGPGGYRLQSPHQDSHQWMCKTHSSHNNLDFCEDHVAHSLIADRICNTGHTLATCGSLCFRAQGSWGQILVMLVSFLILLLRILLFLVVL